MNIGSKISAWGHLTLIAGAMLSGWLGAPPPPPPEVTDVQLLSEEEFAALALPGAQPDTIFDIPTPAVPDIEDSLAPAPAPEDAPATADAPEPEAPDSPDAPPDQPPAPEPPTPDLVEEVPVPPTPEPPQPDAPELPPVADTPAPRAAPRVAPIPVPETPPAPDIADTPTPRVSPEAESPDLAQEEPEAAPEEATTEIVTEAETPSGAPTTSRRPPARPIRQAAAEPEPEPEPETNPLADAIGDAVAEANETAPDPTPRAPSGPPLTGGEKDGLRVSVQQCWNVGSLSSEALQVTVVVSVSMLRDGRPDTTSIRMLDYFDGSDAAARQAFEAARRAIIRCGARGYDLPEEKYDHWREIEMTFNPERMRLK